MFSFVDVKQGAVGTFGVAGKSDMVALQSSSALYLGN